MKLGSALSGLVLLPFTHALPAAEANAAALRGSPASLAQRADGVQPRQTKYTAIPNGQTWYDTAGSPISNFGGGFLKVGTWYYWAGQPFTNGLPPISDAMINLYKSQDLLNWDHVGPIITAHTLDVHGNPIFQYSQVQRPKLLYNEKTSKYVLWGHWEMTASYDASHVFVATADNVEGPYTITEKGHFRPGAGYQDPSAMGERVGGLKLDFATPKNSANTTKPYKPVSGTDYPFRVQQFNNINPSNPTAVNYISQSGGYGEAQIDNWWTYELTGVQFGLILKAVSVQMTPWDLTYYNKYSPYFSISSNNYDYITRYPTTNRSQVTTVEYKIGDPGNERVALVAPDIGPGLDESSSDSTVWVHSGDAAFITWNTTGATVYYTTDGSTPTNSSTQYWTGTRITVSGSPGFNLTVKAVAYLNGQASPVVSQKYTVADSSTAVPVFRPIVSQVGGTYVANAPEFGYQSVKIYSPSYNTECYYTTDGLDPNPAVFGTNIGYGSRDITVWTDPKDGNVYLFSASDNTYNRVWLLNDEYTDVVPDKEYDVFTQLSREAPTLVRNGGAAGEYAYLLTSTQSGWYPNQGQYVRTKDVTAGFSVARDPITGYRNGQSTWSELEPFGDPTTYYSQPTFILNIGTDAKPTYVYVGDRYNTNNLWKSTFVFLPLTINDTGVAVTGNTGSGLLSIEYTPFLQLDVASGTITPPAWKLLSLNKPVNATAATALTADQKAAGTYKYDASAANDGVAYDQDPYDSVQLYYKPVSVPFYWQVDLGQAYDLSWIGLSFQSIGGSDAVNRYTIEVSNDASFWQQVVDNTGNLSPGYQAHLLSGTYRFVRLSDLSVFDIDHNKEADWEVGVYEVSVYGSTPGGTGTTTTPPSQATIKCSHDNCLRQVLGATPLVGDFCASYTTAVVTATAGLPTYVSQCQAKPTRVSSACSCLAQITAAVAS